MRLAFFNTLTDVRQHALGKLKRFSADFFHAHS